MYEKEMMSLCFKVCIVVSATSFIFVFFFSCTLLVEKGSPIIIGLAANYFCTKASDASTYRANFKQNFLQTLVSPPSPVM